MARLKRKSLSEQLAIAITQEIESGLLKDKLPGYRELEKRYDVSRRTCENAARILEANRIIGPPEPGKMRRILRKKIRPRKSKKLRLLVVVDSLHRPTPLDADLLIQIENFWKVDQGELNRVECDLSRIRKPKAQLKKWLKTSETDCLLFETIPPHWLNPVENLGLPCYAMGGSIGNSMGILSGSGFKLAEHIAKSLQKLIELGHREILLVMGRATDKSMKSAIQAQTDRILADHQEVSLSAMIPDLVSLTDWENWWHKELVKKQPTVVLTDSVYLGLSLHSFCLARRIEMPRDLSMVVFDDAEFLTWLNPIPTRYRYKTDQAFRHFRCWVRSGFIPGSIKFCTTDLIEGDTLGPAPARGRITPRS